VHVVVNHLHFSDPVSEETTGELREASTGWSPPVAARVGSCRRTTVT
jgi:hypothetical protein